MKGSGLALRGYVYARVNWSRWIGDCPSPFCQSAQQMSPGWRWFRCEDCGADGEMVWPKMVDDIARLLLMRPNPINRNWHPGESLSDLMRENMEHGVIADLVELGHGSRPLLEIINDQIVLDTLPLPVGARRQIAG